MGNLVKHWYDVKIWRRCKNKASCNLLWVSVIKVVSCCSSFVALPWPESIVLAPRKTLSRRWMISCAQKKIVWDYRFKLSQSIEQVHNGFRMGMVLWIFRVYQWKCDGFSQIVCSLSFLTVMICQGQMKQIFIVRITKLFPGTLD